VTFSSFLEIKQVHQIDDGAIVKIKGTKCIDGFTHEFLWESAPVNTATDILPGPKSRRFHLKLKLTLTIDKTTTPCRVQTDLSPGPGDVTVTITNDPSGPAPITSDPEEVDPIYFP
jgi:hypothetical protein